MSAQYKNFLNSDDDNSGDAIHNVNVNLKVWKKLCAKFDIDPDQNIAFLGRGVYQTAWEFGPKYVLKIFNFPELVKTSKRLIRLNIPSVARCFALVKADPKDQGKTPYYLLVQERCSPNEKKIAEFYSLHKLMSEYSPEMLEAAARLKRMDCKYITDIHGANIMLNANGAPVISDYGCIIFK